MANIADTVTKMDDGTFAFRCPSPDGCGADSADPESRWISSGWPSAKIAQARGLQHIREHVEGTLMQDIDEFRVEQGMPTIAEEMAAKVDLSKYLPKEK